MPENTFNIGDIVWFDHQNWTLKGQIKAIRPDGWADIHVGKHGFGKIPVHTKYLYTSKAAYDAAKRTASERKQAELYASIKTVDDLLHFLDCREMLIKGDASDDAWAVIQRLLNEAKNKC